MLFEQKKGLSIFHRMLISSLIFVLLIVITLTSIFYYFSKRAIYNYFIDEVQQSIDNSEYIFSRIKSALELDLKLIASDPIVDNFVMSPKYSYEINARAVEKLFAERLRHLDSFQNIYFLDYLGKERIRVDKKAGRIREYRYMQDSMLFKAIRSDTPGTVAVELPHAGDDGKVRFLTGVNVIDGDIGQFGGGIFVDYSLDEFLSSFNKIQIQGVSVVWVFAPDGQVLKRPSNAKAVFDPKPYMLQDIAKRPVLIELDEGMLAYQDLSFMPDQPFVRIAMTIPSELVLRDINKTLRFALILFQIIVFIVVVTVYFQSKHFTRPVIELSKAASDMAKGDLSTRVDVKAPGELGVLVESFNRMAKDLTVSQQRTIERSEELDTANANLAALNEELEQRVEERTKSLGEAQRIAKLGSWEWDIDADDIKWSVESYRILGLDPNGPSLTFEQYANYIHQEDRADFNATIERILKEKKTRILPMEYRILLPDGNEKNIYDIGIVTYDENDKPIKMSGTIQDITERKLTEKEKESLWRQLVQAQKLESIGRLTGGIAHDFNNILTSIIGYTKVAIGSLPEEHKAVNMLKTVEGAGKRAAKLVDQLLAYSRKQILERKICNLNTVIMNMSGIINRTIGENVVLNTDLNSASMLTMADDIQLGQVLLNLVVNAQHAMEKGGELTIKTEPVEIGDEFIVAHPSFKPGNYVMLSVKDTGIGMSPEVLEKIFEPFFTTREVGKGSGLGLSTLYGIVKQHNGFVLVESEPGAGATFRIYLPEVEGYEGIERELEVRPKKGGHETILLVDDDTPIRVLLSSVLESVGYNVLTAESGYDAVRISDMFKEKIDMLLTDVIMPRKNGWQLYNEINKYRPDMKVLFISGFVDNSILIDNIKEKNLPFLIKPFEPDFLISRVRDVFDK